MVEDSSIISSIGEISLLTLTELETGDVDTRNDQKPAVLSSGAPRTAAVGGPEAESATVLVSGRPRPGAVGASERAARGAETAELDTFDPREYYVRAKRVRIPSRFLSADRMAAELHVGKDRILKARAEVDLLEMKAETTAPDEVMSRLLSMDGSIEACWTLLLEIKDQLARGVPVAEVLKEKKGRSSPRLPGRFRFIVGGAFMVGGFLGLYDFLRYHAQVSFIGGLIALVAGIALIVIRGRVDREPKAEPPVAEVTEESMT